MGFYSQSYFYEMVSRGRNPYKGVRTIRTIFLYILIVSGKVHTVTVIQAIDTSFVVSSLEETRYLSSTLGNGPERVLCSSSRIGQSLSLLQLTEGKRSGTRSTPFKTLFPSNW